MDRIRALLPAFLASAALLGSGCATSPPVRAFWWQESNPWEVQPTAKTVAHGPYMLTYAGHAVVSAPDDETLYWSDKLKDLASDRSGIPVESLDMDCLFWFYHDWKIGTSVKEQKTVRVAWDEAPGRVILIAEPFTDVNQELWVPMKKAYSIFDGDRRKKIRFRFFLDWTHMKEEEFARVVVFLLDGRNRPIRKASGWLAREGAADLHGVPGTDTEVPRYGWKYRTVRTPEGERQMWQPAMTMRDGFLGMPSQVGALIVKMLNEMTDEELDALEDVSP